jgi:hypothetical protein
MISTLCRRVFMMNVALVRERRDDDWNRNRPPASRLGVSFAESTMFAALAQRRSDRGLFAFLPVPAA